MTTLAVAVGGILTLFIGLQLAVFLRARAMKGKALPPVPGPLGERLAKAGRGLIYFFSPGCAACRPLTPKLQAMSRANPRVHVVDVSHHMEIARALRVMGTPSLVEIEGGKIVGYHVGAPPPGLLERWAQ
jgi:thioredoxin 1